MMGDMAAIDKLNRVRHLIGFLEMASQGEEVNDGDLSEFAWTLRERMDDALASLKAEMGLRTEGAAS